MAGDRRGPGEEGQVGGLEAVVFGVLVFVLGTLLVVNAWAVVDGKMAAASAAREAVRSYVEAPSADVADDVARQAATEAIEVQGGHTEHTVEAERIEGRFARCSRVTWQVRYRVPLVAIPLLGQRAAGMVVTARHSELVDPFRSGLEGRAACDG